MKTTNTPHDSAHLHVQGLSEYVDDRAAQRDEVFLVLATSTQAHAKIKKIDLTQTLKHPGVVAVFTAKDIPHNVWGTIFQDQPLLAQDVVQFYGEPLALLALSDPKHQHSALNTVRVEYQPLVPVLTLDQAIAQKSFIASERSIIRGDATAALQSAPHTLSGVLDIQGQDHFYLESQVTLALPTEDGALEIHSSSQHPTEIQHVVAHALGLPSQKITVTVKRMGGAFGGKESQAAPIAAYAAIAAHLLKRPARINLTKDEDMIITGKRNPFKIKWQAGFDANGKILALDAKLYSDSGAYADLSTSIMERAMLHSDNAYYIPNFKVTGQVCKTNTHPSTAFRGFGGPKGVAMIEQVMEQIAHRLNKDALEVRKLNCYDATQNPNTTPYGQEVANNQLPKLFSELEKNCEYQKRRKKIKAHNQDPTQDTLRGLSLTAVKFGISFTTRFLNQGNALINVYRDGSVQISTGATEMGQGVNARIAAIVANELGISESTRANLVRVMPTSTEKNANTSPTAASSGTDINGAAALKAVRAIKARLSYLALKRFELPGEQWAIQTAGLGTQPETELPPIQDLLNQGYADKLLYKEGQVCDPLQPKTRSIPFDKLVNEAYLSRISLCEYAHYKIEGLDFDKLKGQGNAFLYFTQGTAASEVSVDKFTGEVKVLRTDILMDLGRPILEGLDIGQVTGGFVQGMGWVTTENLVYGGPGPRAGALLTHAPSTYKIPNIQDTPRIFNVNLIENLGNTVNVKGTKAVGEPPLLLALCVWTAIQDALASKRKTVEYPSLPIPATSERVLKSLYDGHSLLQKTNRTP